MNLPALLYPRPEPHVLGSIGLLLVRLATGLMLVPHGYAKISGDVVLLAAGRHLIFHLLRALGDGYRLASRVGRCGCVGIRIFHIRNGFRAAAPGEN